MKRRRPSKLTASNPGLFVGSCGGCMVSTQVRQSDGSGFKSRSAGQIAYFHGVKNRLSTLVMLVMFLVVRTPRKTIGPVSDRIWGA